MRKRLSEPLAQQKDVEEDLDGDEGIRVDVNSDIDSDDFVEPEQNLDTDTAHLTEQDFIGLL